MDDYPEYTTDGIVFREPDDSEFDAVDLSHQGFQRNLVLAATSALAFARTLVSNRLPDELAYTIRYGCSYDGNPLVGDEKTFPEDYEQDSVTAESSAEVARKLWRDGFVPEWINVAVSGEDGVRTLVRLDCCGRYSASPRLMYHVREGYAPFHVLGPPVPPGFVSADGSKFDLHWRTAG